MEIFIEQIKRQPCADHETDCLAPTFSQAFRWFRKEYEYEISIHKLIEEDGYMGSIGWEGVEDIMEQVEGTTYEEAELECLRKLIEIVKNGKIK